MRLGDPRIPQIRKLVNDPQTEIAVHGRARVLAHAARRLFGAGRRARATDGEHLLMFASTPRSRRPTARR